ncbi:Glycosyltransferase, catalytic subunit of cellulose synthase and poly-beta-1,6-N-acetylglucosamine synthase [Marinobacter antarcticus]|uniref:Glycosyltransferase, catalytic subunit of cellulose synthase and poly-beta-1,6-N-acetylglucosamine synthase n=1 Tax=Marinobacter antarcticus TaxID=564117 RepID=A0A1M6SMX4_9GAMM|nr:glycosyltransferase [Marinobacter antarcticus]SHK46101.1 Glycosyltransferase, catalytic subunit of cellulose synthase and poly-beta-1,6-N-acetylglucosamine synthase [Marinobacter antarcticus]
MGFKFISVIVPAHNEQEYISQCLESLASQDYPTDNYEIIVVDNNSIDKTQEIALQFNVQIIEQKTGPVGRVRNAGAKAAKGEVLAFIDGDCVAPTDWLSKGASLLLDKDTVCGGGYLLRPSPYWIEKAWLLENKAPPKELLGGCIFIRKDDFFLAGPFDEKITSGEDTKLSMSLRNQNYSLIMTEELDVIHLGNPTTLKNFFLRQIWHSENYLQNWHETVKDPTFYFLILFLIGFISLLTGTISENITAMLISTTIITGTPLIFTIKRLRRSRNIDRNLRNLPAIYFLDFIYLSGRLLGLGKSTWKAFALFIPPQSRRGD